MGRLILVSGANGSGKSAFAEKLAVEVGGELYYIATMCSTCSFQPKLGAPCSRPP